MLQNLHGRRPEVPIVKVENLFQTERVAKEQHPANMPRIGKLTAEERLKKVQRYIEKRRRRMWQKKVSYSCRKETADQRLRIKGRFVKNEDQKEIIRKVTGDPDSQQK